MCTVKSQRVRARYETELSEAQSATHHALDKAEEWARKAQKLLVDNRAFQRDQQVLQDEDVQLKQHEQEAEQRMQQVEQVGDNRNGGGRDRDSGREKKTFGKPSCVGEGEGP